MRAPGWLVLLGAIIGASALQPAGALAFTSRWPVSDLPPNPDVTFGTLPNGMRYAIRHNASPPGEVSMRLVIEAGSMQETHDQEGLAHLLEHMAFRGSTHVADGEVIKTLERLGLRLGADTNAVTSQEDTTYSFNLAKSDESSVDTGLKFLREIAGELVLSQAALESERRVVAAEARQRAGPDMDVGFAHLAAQFPGHPYIRSPIGRAEVVENTTPAQLRAFYDAYYRPERAVLVVVGDFDPVAIETELKALFSDWRGHGQAGNDPPPFTPLGRGRTVVVDVQPGAHTTSLSFAWVPPYRPPDQSRAGRLEEIVRGLGESAVSMRISQMSEAADRPFASGGIGSYSTVGVARGESMGAGWIADLPATADILIRAQRQIMAEGVTQAELDRVVTSWRSQRRREAAGSSAFPIFQTSAIASRLASEAEIGQLDLSEPQQLELFEEAVDGLTAERVNAVLRGRLAGEGPIVFLATDKPPQGGQPTVEKLLAEADAAPLAVYAPAEAKPWTHTDFGVPGKVAEQRTVADLGVTMVRFGNGVRLTLKPGSASPGQFSVLVRFGHGRLDQPRNHLDASDLATTLLMGGGLNDLRQSDIPRALLGHPVAALVGTADDAFTVGTGPFSVAGADLDLEMQYLAAMMTHPGWRAETWKTFLVTAEQDDRASLATPEGVFGREVRALLHPGDQRWVFNTAEMRATWTPEQARAFIEPILQRSDIEILIVGDVAPARAIAAVAKTFGAFPKRAGLPELPGARDARFPRPTAHPIELRHNGRADQAIAEISWRTTDRYSGWRDIAPTVVLADIMRQRVVDQLRTADGETYSPNAGADFSPIFRGWGRISLLVTCRPEAIDRIYAVIDAMAADLAAHPISTDELQRALRPEIVTATRSLQRNGYWMGALAGAQTDGRRLKYVRQTLPRLSAVTAADVQRVARRWLRPDRSFRIEVTPEPTTTVATAEGS